MDSENKKYLWSGLKIGIAVLLIYVIFKNLNIETLVESIKQVNMFWIAFAIIIYVFLSMFMAFRFYMGLKFMKEKISYFKIYWANLFGLLCSDFTPGRFGYAAIVYDLNKKYKIPLSKGLVVLSISGATDMLAKGVYALIGLLFLVFIVNNSIMVQGALLSAGAVIFAGCVFLYITWFDFKHLDNFIKKLPVLGKRLHEFVVNFRTAGKELKSKFMFFMMLTFVSWMIRGLEWYALSLACGVGLPFFTILMLQPLLTAVRYIPITPAGIGLFEGVVILGFSIFGIPPESALLFAFFDRVNNIFVDLFGLVELRKL